MIALRTSNFWYTNSVKLTRPCFLCTLYNISSTDLTNLRILLAKEYNSKLYILKSKILTKLLLTVDIHNKSIILTSHWKNPYFFTNILIDSIDIMNADNRDTFKIFSYFNKGKLIDINTLSKYKTHSILDASTFIITIGTSAKHFIYKSIYKNIVQSYYYYSIVIYAILMQLILVLKKSNFIYTNLF